MVSISTKRQVRNAFEQWSVTHCRHRHDHTNASQRLPCTWLIHVAHDGISLQRLRIGIWQRAWQPFGSVSSHKCEMARPWTIQEQFRVVTSHSKLLPRLKRAPYRSKKRDPIVGFQSGSFFLQWYLFAPSWVRWDGNWKRKGQLVLYSLKISFKYDLQPIQGLSIYQKFVLNLFEL